MTAAVTRQEHDLDVAEPAEQQVVGRPPERRVDAFPRSIGEAFEP